MEEGCYLISEGIISQFHGCLQEECWPTVHPKTYFGIQQILEYASGINSVEVVLFSVPGCALPNELLHYRKNHAMIGVLLEFCGACRPP